MTAAEALEKIRGYAAAGRFVISSHAWARMQERHVRYNDLRNALIHAQRCTAQPDEKWRVSGPDLDAEELTVVVTIEDGLLVVTVF